MPAFETPPEERRLGHEALIAREFERMKDANRKRAERKASKTRRGPGQRPSRRPITPEDPYVTP
jgi:hypothetical protein